MAGTAVATVTSRKGRGLIRVDVDLTCVAGAVSATPIGSYFGRLVGIICDPVAGAGATMSTTADILLTDTASGAPIISDLDMGGSASLYRPTQVVTANTGVAITPATTAPNVNRDIFLAGPISIAIANATTTDTARVTLLVQEAN